MEILMIKTLSNSPTVRYACSPYSKYAILRSVFLKIKPSD